MGFLDKPKRPLPLRREFTDFFCVECKRIRTFYLEPNRGFYCTKCDAPERGWDDTRILNKNKIWDRQKGYQKK